MDKIQLRGHFAMFGANLMWGLMSPVAKMVMAGAVISPLVVTDFRITGAAVLFWVLSCFMPREHVPVTDLFRLAGAAVLGIVFNQGCFIFGVGFTSPGEASIITTTMPMWVMVLAALILKEPVTMKKIGGIVLGAAGALVLVMGAGSRIAEGSNPVLGDILVFCAQFSYALYLTLYKNFIRRYSLVTLMKWMFLFAAIVVLPLSLPAILSVEWGMVTATEMWGIAYVVIGATFGSYILVMIGQKALRPTLVGMYNYVQPIVASAVGVCLGLDTFSPVKVFAVALIFSGVWLVTISKSRSQNVLKNP
ncbi:MAG: DMT family transporter, partial [Odoribacter sp.]|nr:DMT family transporter [Odoribacter sp.]